LSPEHACKRKIEREYLERKERERGRDLEPGKKKKNAKKEFKHQISTWSLLTHFPT
jgi:hypothetical protein